MSQRALERNEVARVFDVPPWLLPGAEVPRLRRVRWALRRVLPSLVWP